MTPRLATSVLASAMIRRVAVEGGNGTIVAKGEPESGSILLICLEKGRLQSIRERILDARGTYRWTSVGPSEPADLGTFLERRRSRDPDLWIVELDIPNAERFAAETIGEG